MRSFFPAHLSTHNHHQPIHRDAHTTNGRMMLGCIATCTSVIPVWLQSTAAQTQPPNIVLIVADDQSWNGTSVRMDPDVPESQSDYHQTPTLEALANAGMRFSSAYVSPLCVMTQMALQTGKSAARLQKNRNFNYNGFDFPLMPTLVSRYPGQDDTIASEISIAQSIKEVHPEYRTGHFGKYAEAMADWAYFDDGVKEGTLPEDVDPKSMFTFANRANEFMQRSVDDNKPFFAMLTHNAVKGPWEALPETVAKYESLPRGDRHNIFSYAAMTEDLDTSFGMILNKIQHLGVEDNTYVIYISDNGRSGVSNEPLRAGKGWLWEGGIRVPLIIKGPGIDAGAVSDVPVTVMDLFATLTELVGNDYPVHDEVDGTSLVPILHNGGQLPEHMTNLRRPYGENGELFFHHQRAAVPHSAVIDGEFKLLRFYEDPGTPDTSELYTLADDLSESHDLSSVMPEMVATLNAKLDRWLQGVDASLAYDVAAPIQLVWRGDHPGEPDDVELDPVAWRPSTRI